VPKKEKINLITLGCPKNVVDSEFLLRQLAGNNLPVAGDGEEGTIAVINTCGFIEAAKRESVETILHAVEMKREGKLSKVIVMGCLSERYAEELRKEIPGVDAFIGANKIGEVVRELGGHLRRELLGERILTTGSHTAYLKISEGCDRPCSFCSIPLMRGGHVSRPVEEILREAEKLPAKEIVVIAQDTTSYGLDLGGTRMLGTLLRRLGGLEQVEWIRLMYAFPTGFPMDVLEEFSRNGKICRYLDIPVQHVSEKVLSSMRRGISTGKLRRLLADIRASVPGIALRTTLIVGYPAEGEAEFRELLEFVRETEFDRLGVFAYSQEEGTGAYPLGDPHPRELKEERLAMIMEAQQEIALRKNGERIGQTLRVLVDRISGAVAYARTEFDAPEVDNEVTVTEAGGLRQGTFASVDVVDAEAYDLFAVPTTNENAGEHR
jgi:ribosomal protein S12 methylthiotransferase